MTRALVPVRRQITLPAHLTPRQAEAAVMRHVAGKQIASITPLASYPGAGVVPLEVITLEPAPTRRPWHLYLLGLAAVLVAGAVLVMVLADPYLFVGALILTGVFALACMADKAKKGSKTQ